MPRAGRIVVPEVPHHVIQRGNRRQRIFASDQDRRLYLKYLGEALARHATSCLAWCLMDNHVHLVLTPPDGGALRAVMASSHTRFAQWVNRSQDLSGHLFQGRFGSYPMSDSHLIAAVRYVENNPVKAGLVEHAEEWAWSSARAHVSGKPDGLTSLEALSAHLPNWRAYLRKGAEAAEHDESIDAALRSGRPQGSKRWVESVAPPQQPRGRPKKIGTVPI